MTTTQRIAKNPNIAHMEGAGELRISEPKGNLELIVPLSIIDESEDTDTGSVDLFEGGVVWEDASYRLSFEFRTTTKVNYATLSVNDNNELYTSAQHESMLLGGELVHKHVYTVIVNNDRHETNKPFAYTCGFARIEIRVHFFEGPDVFLATPDIISLDEPRRGGQTGETAEESNVREMYSTLTQVENNQAAEWMFANGSTTLINKRLSFDENTDWAYAPMSMRLQVASDALDYIDDGFVDTSDAFPTILAEGVCEERGNRYDTDENREVRALISSMENQVRQMRGKLAVMQEESSELHKKLCSLIQREGSRRRHPQSLPALKMIEQRVNREKELYAAADDLHWRIEEMLALVDSDDKGFGKVGEVEFHVPELTGVYAEDKTYSKLHEAMREWSICADDPIERVDVSLHAIKPDKLFEYSALHKMLGWLWGNNFIEDESRPKPIDRFKYRSAAAYTKFENESRCANTYHLMRGDADGTGTTYVDLYYQPVIYFGEREENGIDLHRTSNPDDLDVVFWTPDYLLVIRQDDMERVFLVDAKYCRKKFLDDKMAECVKKYVKQTTRGKGCPGEGIDGIVLLAGKMDAPQLNTEKKQTDEGAFLQVIAPFNKHTGKEKLTWFFGRLGVAPAKE